MSKATVDMECTGCGKVIVDQMMKANDRMFHVMCFKCSTCGKQIQAGETFALKGNTLYCKNDYDDMVAAEQSVHSRSTTPITGDDKDDDGKKRTRTTITEEQKILLKRAFEENHIPDVVQRNVLAEQTGLPPRVIQVWFQNRRAKEKKKQEQKDRQGGMWMNAPPDAASMYGGRSPPLSPQMQRNAALASAIPPNVLINSSMTNMASATPPRSPVPSNMYRNQYVASMNSQSVDAMNAQRQQILQQQLAAVAFQMQMNHLQSSSPQPGAAPPPPGGASAAALLNPNVASLKTPSGMPRVQSMPDLKQFAAQGVTSPLMPPPDATAVTYGGLMAPGLQISTSIMDPLSLKDLEETVSSMTVTDHSFDALNMMSAAGGDNTNPGLLKDESHELDNWLQDLLASDDTLMKRSKSTPVLPPGAETPKRSGSARKNRHMPYNYHGHGEDGSGSLPSSPRLRAEAYSPSPLASFSAVDSFNTLPTVSVEAIQELMFS